MPDAKKILIVEDEKSIAHAMKLKLEKAGYSVIVAINGKNGLEIAAKEKPDLILLDLVMPVMDGFEFLKKKKEKKISASVIVLTNLSQEEEEKAIAAGAKKCLVKSDTSISEVVTEVKKII